MGKCYSIDGENYNYESIDDLKYCVEVGQEIHEADAIPADITKLFDVDNIIEMLNERAWDSFGESAEDFPDCSTEAVKELDSMVKAWLNKNCKSNFWHVENVRKYVIVEGDLESM